MNIIDDFGILTRLDNTLHFSLSQLVRTNSRPLKGGISS